MLSYNSQNWRQDAGGVWNLGKDIGFGYGWRLQAGSIYPVIYNGSVQYLIFSDATGAEYRLDQDNGNWIFRSKEGLHLWMDWGTGILYFPDGSRWYMWIQSSALEPDAGTRYPIDMVDTNGHHIYLGYQTGVGANYVNTSARLTVIQSSDFGYGFSYSGGALPHLTGFYTPTGAYTLSYNNTSLKDPFGGAVFGNTSLLSSFTTNGLGTSHQFTYYSNASGTSSGEMTQVTTPLGGTLGWTYRTYNYSGPNLSYREVATRTMSSGSFSGAVSNSWTTSTDTGASQHATWTIADSGANSSKVWTFGTSGVGQALPASYEERGPGGTALLHTDYTWTTDSVSNIYVGTVLNTQNPGASQIQSKSVQTLDTYGNITQSQVFDYSDLGKPAKTYNFTYVTDANYTSRYIRNRLLSASVTPAGGSATLWSATPTMAIPNLAAPPSPPATALCTTTTPTSARASLTAAMSRTALRLPARSAWRTKPPALL
jgi:hypothetical protein